MKNFLIKLMGFAFALCLMLGTQSCCERVDAGHEGILVNLYGDDKLPVYGQVPTLFRDISK